MELLIIDVGLSWWLTSKQSSWRAIAHGGSKSGTYLKQQRIAGKGAYVCVFSHFSCGTWYLINGKANISSAPILPKYFCVFYVVFYKQKSLAVGTQDYSVKN